MRNHSFFGLRTEKLKAGNLGGPQICQLIINFTNFEALMNELERLA